ncbi:MAG: hypothetical protein R2754_18880 [Microthrixaceae bacterium]
MAEPRYDGYLVHADDAHDAATAAALRRGLQRLTSPWWRRQALRVHSTSATSSGGDSGGDAAGADSRWLVLLASPAAARSERVDHELRQWVARHGVGSILPVLIDGSWTWDEAAGDFRWNDADAVDAVPPALRRAFVEEPRHLDLSWARGQSDLSLSNARFRDQVAELAAPMHGITKEDLAGADVRQQRRNRRQARRAVAGLVALAMIAALATLVAIGAQREAVAQRSTAEEQALLANERARVATSNHLSSESASPELPIDLRYLLAAQAYEMARSPQSDAALFQVLANPSPDQVSGSAPGLVGDFEALAGVEFSDAEPGRLLLDDRGAVIDGERRFAPGTWEEETLGLPAGGGVSAVGNDGRFAVATRPPADGQEPLVFEYEDFSDVEPLTPEEEEGGLSSITGPMSCAGILGSETGCDEVALIDMDSGEERLLPTEIGIPEHRLNSVVPPNPTISNRFTEDGSFVVSHAALGDGIFVTPTDGGQPALVTPIANVSDFGLLGNDRAWRLAGSSIQIIDLASAKVSETYDLSGLGTVAAADLDDAGEFAVVGSLPSTVTVLELKTGDQRASKDIGNIAEEIEIGPQGRWGAVVAGGEAHLLDLETLTTIRTAQTAYYVPTPDTETGAEMAFDPDGAYLLVRPLNASPPRVHVVSLNPDDWYLGACAAAGRTLTRDEWNEHVGLPDYEPACADVDPPEVSITPVTPVPGASSPTATSPASPGTTRPPDAAVPAAPGTPAAPATSSAIPPAPSVPAGSSAGGTAGERPQPGGYCALIDESVLQHLFPDGVYDEGRCRVHVQND